MARLKREAAALAAAAIAATPAAPAQAHDLTTSQKRVYKHRWQLSTYKVRWYTGRGRWTTRPRHRWCRELRFPKARGRCYLHRANLRWHEARVAKLGRMLWPPRPATPSAPAVDGCLSELVERESGWSVTATNPTTGAYGLPQALPGSKMAAFGPDWATNPAVQLAWMRHYVAGRYGSSCAALSFQTSHGWY